MQVGGWVFPCLSWFGCTWLDTPHPFLSGGWVPAVGYVLGGWSGCHGLGGPHHSAFGLDLFPTWTLPGCLRSPLWLVPHTLGFTDCVGFAPHIYHYLVWTYRLLSLDLFEFPHFPLGGSFCRFFCPGWVPWVQVLEYFTNSQCPMPHVGHVLLDSWLPFVPTRFLTRCPLFGPLPRCWRLPFWLVSHLVWFFGPQFPSCIHTTYDPFRLFCAFTVLLDSHTWFTRLRVYTVLHCTHYHHLGYMHTHTPHHIPSTHKTFSSSFCFLFVYHTTTTHCPTFLWFFITGHTWFHIQFFTPAHTRCYRHYILYTAYMGSISTYTVPAVATTQT